MKIFSAKQVYEADKFTIDKEQITSDALMERAALRVFTWLHDRLQGATVKIHLFCGIGNNGGDGLVAARHLKEHGYTIEVYVVTYSEKRSEDFLINLERLKGRKVRPDFIGADTPFPPIGKDDIVVDAIFGIGLNRPPHQWVIDLMEYLNESGAFILSVDIPSGLFMDRGLDRPYGVMKADHVLTFQAPKLVFFLPETGKFIRHWEILDIGLDAEYLEKTATRYELIGKNEVLSWYKPREKFSHKGTYGHSLIIGGSYGKIGAVLLASRACLAAGSGLVTSFVPQCGYIPLQSGLPEVMVLTDIHEKMISRIEQVAEATVIGIGVGMGTEKVTMAAFSDFLDGNQAPLVIDADGLNMLSKDRKMLKKLPPKTVLTPHPKELVRLIGEWKDDFDKLDKAAKFSGEYDCILVIKGANTLTVYKDKGYVNNTGNPGMATGGSGDVLTGIITGLMAQGYEPLVAALFGVYLHGRAGDIAVENLGYQSLTASAIIDGVGPAILDLFKLPQTNLPAEEQG